MPHLVRTGLGVLIVLALIGGPPLYGWHSQAQTRNFRVVKDGVLYRSGQMTRAGLKQVVHDYGIRTVITLRAADVPGEPPPDVDEENWCRKNEINHFRIAPARWWSVKGPAPADEGVRRFRAIMNDPDNYPVLVHCFAGIHRTGAYCAVFRMEHDHWTNAQAIAEMKSVGYDNLDEELDILGYLEQYVPTWKQP